MIISCEDKVTCDNFISTIIRQMKVLIDMIDTGECEVWTRDFFLWFESIYTCSHINHFWWLWFYLSMIKFNGNFIGRLDPTLKDTKTDNLHTFFWINAILWCEMQTFSEWIYFFVCLFVCLGISIDFYISMERGLVLKCHNSMEIRYINAELRQTAHHNIHRLTDANTIHALSLQKLVDSQ